MQYKFGKLPARPDSVKLKLTDYASALPTAPKTFGHYGLVSAWNMLGNDQYGDCVWAGAAHETMMQSLEGGHGALPFTDQCVLSDYSACTGFNANDPNTDQGTDMATAAAYRQKTGIVDANGTRHKVDAYVSVAKGDLDQTMSAAYVFGAVGIGIECPDFMMTQFSDGQPWDYTGQSYSIEGGHYIPVVGRNSAGNILVITWGRLHAMTPAFFAKFNDETIAYINLDILNGKGYSPENFNEAALQADLKLLHA